MDNQKKYFAFKLTKLFEIAGSKTTPKKNIEFDNDGEFPYITTQATNNGVAGWSNQYTEEGNVITIDSATIGYASYQSKNFTASDHVEKLIPKFNLTEEVALFIVTILNETRLNYGYGYEDKRSQTALKKEVIPLPADENNNPDWKYMENYIKHLMMISKNKLMKLSDKPLIKEIDVTSWKSFLLGQLFDIKKGKRLTKANMIPGDIKFVGASGFNNGETNRISNNTYLHPANVISVCYNGSVGETFYQDEPFWASDDVNVLYPKFDMTRNIAMFMIPIIRNVGVNEFKFIDKWTKDLMEVTEIKLPITSDNRPNWEYMEKYIEKIYDMSVDKFKSLSKLY